MAATLGRCIPVEAQPHVVGYRDAAVANVDVFRMNRRREECVCRSYSPERLDLVEGFIGWSFYL